MKKYFKTMAIMMALVLASSTLAACGSKGETSNNGGDASTASTGETKSASIKGETQSWGYYSALVPEGYVLKGGDLFEEDNPEAFNINLKDSSLTYFMFGLYDEDGAVSSIDTTKEVNEGTSDVTVEYNGVTWTGVAYDSLGIPCFSMYAEFDGDFVVVTAAGNAYDSDITNAILSSLTVDVLAEE